MPRSLFMKLGQDVDVVRDYPLQMLNMALNECLEDVRGLRPDEEIAELIKVTDDIKTNNPKEDWECLGRLGAGGQAEVFKVRRKSDNMIAAMKRMDNVTQPE